MAHDPRLFEAVARGICVKAYGALGDPNGNEWAEFEHLATAALDAIEAMGCVVVPVEPTLTQVFAGQEALLPDHPAMPGPATAQVTTGSFDKIYRAMLAARPGAQP